MTIRFAAAEEAAALPLRKEPKREGTLRLIDVQDFDLSACGGTHVARTGAIGIIAVSATERFRGGTRVTFLCGGRAADGLSARCATRSPAACARCRCCRRSCPAAIERLQADAKDLRRQVKDFQSKLAAQEADALADGATAAVGEAGRRGADRLGRGRLEDHRLPHRRAARARRGARVGTAPAAIVVARAADVAHDAGALLEPSSRATAAKAAAVRRWRRAGA